MVAPYLWAFKFYFCPLFWVDTLWFNLLYILHKCGCLLVWLLNHQFIIFLLNRRLTTTHHWIVSLLNLWIIDLLLNRWFTIVHYQVVGLLWTIGFTIFISLLDTESDDSSAIPFNAFCPPPSSHWVTHFWSLAKVKHVNVQPLGRTYVLTRSTRAPLIVSLSLGRT